MVCSLNPVITCVMAYFLLKERMSTADILFFVAVFFSCMMVLVGAARNQASEKENEVVEAASTLALIGLIAMPLLISG